MKKKIVCTVSTSAAVRPARSSRWLERIRWTLPAGGGCSEPAAEDDIPAQSPAPSPLVEARRVEGHGEFVFRRAQAAASFEPVIASPQAEVGACRLLALQRHVALAGDGVAGELAVPQQKAQIQVHGVAEGALGGEGGVEAGPGEVREQAGVEAVELAVEGKAAAGGEVPRSE